MRARHIRFAPLLVGLLLLAACGPRPSLAPGTELDDANFRRGQQLVRQARNQEALSTFLGLIDERRGAAPESHLEVGLLYQTHFKDPIAAIYHFRRYLEQQPTSRQAPLVRQRIEAAKRDFASALPGSPLESQTERLQFLETVERLKRENEQLKTELTALRGGLAQRSTIPAGDFAPGPVPAPANSPATLAGGGDGVAITRAPFESAASLQPEPGMRQQPAPVQPSQLPPAQPAAGAATGRLHTVAAGDTLYSLAARYYSDRSRWRDILAANRDQLPSENTTLRIGMQLRIPNGN